MEEEGEGRKRISIYQIHGQQVYMKRSEGDSVWPLINWLLWLAGFQEPKEMLNL